MHKRIMALFALVAAVLLSLAVPAQATGGGDHDAHNKPVTFCHATASESHPFNKITTSVFVFYQAGHIDHEGDIWEAFSYTTVGGDTINVPAQGDTSLLAFEDCQRPRVNERVTRPDVTFNDPCGTENDVFSVAGGRGYTVGSVTTDGVKQSISVTLADGFDWTDGTRDAIVFERPVFTNVDCGLPETGGAEYDRMIGVGALGGLLLVAGMTLLYPRRRRTNV